MGAGGPLFCDMALKNRYEKSTVDTLADPVA